MVHLDTPDLALELAELRRRNLALALVLDDLAAFVREAYGQAVVVTCIHRSRAVQAASYGRGTKKVPPDVCWTRDDLLELAAGRGEALESIAGALARSSSPHLLWHAADIAHRLYSPAEIEGILRHLRRHDATNLLPEITAARSRTAWLHEAGSRGPHLHIQYKGPPCRSTRPCS